MCAPSEAAKAPQRRRTPIGLTAASDQRASITRSPAASAPAVQRPNRNNARIGDLLSPGQTPSRREAQDKEHQEDGDEQEEQEFGNRDCRAGNRGEAEHTGDEAQD